MVAKVDMVGIWAVDTAAKVQRLLEIAGPRGQQMFDTIQAYAATPAEPPTSLADMQDTYTFPDVDTIDQIARDANAGLQFHEFMSALAQSPDPAGAAITTASGTNATPAVVTLSGFWEDGTALTIQLDTDTAAGQDTGAQVVIGDEGPIGAAAELAPLLEAQLTDVQVTANGATLEFLAINTALSVTVTGAVVS